MATSKRVSLGTFTLNVATRTAISIPAVCVAATIYNTDTQNAAQLFTQDVGGTGLTLPASAQAEFSWPSPIGDASEIILWGLAVAGTPALTVETIQ